jgi:hypothetical protein
MSTLPFVPLGMAPFGAVPRSRPRVRSLLSMPQELLDWHIRFMWFADPPTLEAVEAAMAEVERTTARRLGRAIDAGKWPEAAYWKEVYDGQLRTLQRWLRTAEPPPRRGRRKGSGLYFRNASEFREIMVHLIRLCAYDEKCVKRPTQPMVARYLQSRLPADSAAQIRRSTESVVKLIQRRCRRFRYEWDELVNAALADD